MTLQQINYLLTISESRSMNKAAEKLFIAQPTLTGAVRDVENELGIQIFHRTHKGVTTTVEGDQFLVIPFKDDDNIQSTMTIGYITKKNNVLSNMGKQFIDEVRRELEIRE